jgi:hypothetical protein
MYTMVYKIFLLTQLINFRKDWKRNMRECWMLCIFRNWYVTALDNFAKRKGYLVTVPIGDDGQPVFMLEGWDMRFSTSEKVFFKCSEIYGYFSIFFFIYNKNWMNTMEIYIRLLLVQYKNGILICRSRS